MRGLLAVLSFAILLILLALAPGRALASDRTLVSWDALVPADKASPQTTPVETDSVPSQEDLDTPASTGSRSWLRHGGLTEDWQKPAFDVEPAVLGKDVLIDGYVLPLTWEGRRVVEFLLVPWIGACIHTPAPPPNQIVHVSYPEGLRLKKPFEPVRLSGVLEHDHSAYLLFHVDGSRPIQTTYSLQGAALSGQPGDIVAASASEIPAFQRLQVWANSLFTDGMRALGNGGSAGAMLIALALSFGYGALHTLGPGHGKSVVVSYFIGTGGSLRRGVTMGVRIAVFHVLSAVVVVFLFDLAVRQATGLAPSDYRAIRLTSYAMIIAIGSVMLWQAVSAILAQRSEALSHDHGAYSHAHAHAHAHGPHEGSHTHGTFSHEGPPHSGCAACAAAASPQGSGWLAASVGVVPCTGALIVMLFGLANDLVWPAIMMVAAISAGMAVAMSAIGVAALWGRQWAEAKLGFDSVRRARFELRARMAGALCVFAIGTALFALTLAVEPMPPALYSDSVVPANAVPADVVIKSGG